MSLNYKSYADEKVVFKISVWFWRFLVGLSALGIGLGILVFLWGMTPSLQPSVKKESYPPVAEVTYDELAGEVLPEEVFVSEPVKEPVQVVSKDAVVAPQPETVPEHVPGEQAFAAAMDSLRKLIPPDKYRWASRGHWEYPYGKRYWEYYRDARYRKWRVDKLGIEARLERTFKATGADDYPAKLELMTAYLHELSSSPEEKRERLLRALCTYSTESIANAIRNVTALGSARQHFGDEVEPIEKLANFGRKNPNDGYALIEYSNRFLSQCDSTVRIDMLKALIQSYYSHFNNHIDRQIEVTDHYLTLADRFEPEYQVEALTNYYRMFIRKNAERAQEIEQIDWRYENGLSDAQSVQQAKRAGKASLRIGGLYAIGGGIVTVAFLALVLAQLSVQRNVERLVERVERQEDASVES